MALVRTIDWTATIAAVQAVLDGPPPQTQATLDSGVIVRDAVAAAGAVYDVQSNVGILNQTAYALSIQAWAATTAPAWVELDRVCRAIYKLIPPPPPLALAVFGMSGVAPWTKNVSFTVTGGLPSRTGAVVPTVANGFNYVPTVTGVSGATEPIWPTFVGGTVFNGTTSFECIAAIVSSGGQPASIPWDVTLTGPAVSLSARAAVAALVAAVNPGLASLLSSTNAIFNAAIAARPASVPALDNADLASTSALNVAIANANAWIAASAVT